MKLWFKILSVVVITFCFWTTVSSREVALEGRRDAITALSASTRLDRKFTLGDLTDAYDFVSSAFILSGQVDMPEDPSVDKGKKGTVSRVLSCQDSILKSHRVICQEMFWNYLFTKHSQGFYIFRIGRLII